MKKYIVGLCLFGLFFSAFGQMYYQDGRQVCCGDSLLTGSYQGIHINPANLGRAGRSQKSLGLLQFGGNFYANGLDKGQLLDFAFTDQLLDEEQKAAIVGEGEVSENFFYDGNIEINWLSFSFASPKTGGIAINVKDQVFSTLNVPNSLIGLMLQGTNSDAFEQAGSSDELRAIGNGSFGNYHHLRTASISYGRRVASVGDIRMYAGLTYKRIWAIGYYQAEIENARFSGRSAFSDLYRINYGTLNLGTADGRRELLSNVGGGNAFDLGASVDIGDGINVGMSVVNIGNISWRDQIVEYEGDFARIVDSVGIGLVNSYDFSEEAADLYDLMDSGPGNEFESRLHTRLRMQGTFRIRKRLHAGMDITLPLLEEAPDVLNYQPMLIAGNLNWQVAPRLLTLNGGLLYSDRWGMRLPFGVMVGINHKAMLSISTADLLTFFTSRDPYASLSIATANFGF